ncbi:MAG: hypothetical protein QXH80_03165 [Candidatus Nanoarchaeia archaeon]
MLEAFLKSTQQPADDASEIERKLAKARELAENGAMPKSIELMTEDLAKNPALLEDINYILNIAYKKSLRRLIKLAEEEASYGDVLAVKIILDKVVDYVGLAGANINNYESKIRQIKINCYENAIRQSTDWISKYGKTDSILARLKLRLIQEYRIKKDNLLDDSVWKS